jgi:hypothetical protein
LTSYDAVRFAAGDQVTISADGCVQTGGAGDTWKRYAAPLDGDGLYYGTIWIPYATLQPVGLPLVNNTTLTVPQVGVDPTQLYLRLGYVDDDYGDNGYWGHDDGTQDQCRGVGNAQVTLTIVHNAPPPPADPLDLRWGGVDMNGVPVNPHWAWQEAANLTAALPTDLGKFGCYLVYHDTTFGPPCTTQGPTFDMATTCGFGDGPLGGHVNWGAATYQGRIRWKDKSTPWSDDDYNFQLFPLTDAYAPTLAGLTVANNGRVGLEFDSDETVDHWNSPWWSTFHEAVDADVALANALGGQPTWPRTSKLVLDKFAIVTGLFGIDAAHTPATESHPVWLMAIDIGAQQGGPDDDYWAFFARNWGDEGWCGSQDHTVTFNQNVASILIPWRPGASDVSVDFKDTSIYGKNSGESWASYQPGYGVLLTEHLQDPAFHGWLEGEIHLKWTGGSPRFIPPEPDTGNVEEQASTEQMLVDDVISRLPKETIDKWAALAPPGNVQPDAGRSLKSGGAFEFRPPVPPRPITGAVEIPGKTDLERARIAILTAHYRGVWPFDAARSTNALAPIPAALGPNASQPSSETQGASSSPSSRLGPASSPAPVVQPSGDSFPWFAGAFAALALIIGVGLVFLYRARRST